MKNKKNKAPTKRDLTIESLRESEEVMRYIVKHDTNALAIYDCNLHYIAVSIKYLQDYNVKEENIIGRHHYEVFPEIPQRWRDIHQRCLNGEILKNDDDFFVRLDGSITYNKWECRPWYRMNGEIGGMITYTEVTTERKKVDKIIQESEKKHRAIYENSMDGIILTSPDGKTLAANPAACKMFGYTEDELIEIGRSGLEDISDLRLAKILAERNKKGKAFGEVSFIRKDGTHFPAEISTTIFQRNAGEERSCIMVRDITERKDIEQKNRFKANLIKNVGQSVIATDKENRITYWNTVAERMYGWTQEEVIGKNIVEVIPTDLPESEVLKILSNVEKETVWSGECIVKRKDGTTFPIFLTDAPILDANGKFCGIVGVSSDITERKRSEETLRKLSSAIEQTIDTIVITNKEGIIEYVNPAFEVVTGYTAEEAIGKTPRILKSGIYPDKVYQDMWTSIISGQVFRTEIINKKKNGELYHEEKTISPIYDDNNYITHFIGTGVDISERKRAEQELIKAKEKAEESDRLKSAFLANMSHEIRTPLNSILGFSSLLADMDLKKAERNEFIHHILKNGNQLLTIISDIMDISKIESNSLTVCKRKISTNNCLKEIHKQFSSQLDDKDIKLLINIPEEEEPVILADPERLNQVLMNLINNAIKFTKKGEIELGYQLKDKEVEFHVKDSGIGIPKEFHDKIFERFRQIEGERTRNYGGNGLGLAITKSLVGLMNGRIWLESEPNKGSTFYFTLPVFQDSF